MPNGLDPDQDWHYVEPDLDPNCLPRLPAELARKESKMAEANRAGQDQTASEDSVKKQSDQGLPCLLF